MTFRGFTRCIARLAGALLMSVTQWGCETSAPARPSAALLPGEPLPALRILPGDLIEISVFGLPELNAQQSVRVDGKIAVKLGGELQAADKTPEELRAELTALYEKQVQVTSVTVMVRSMAAVYVTGAVLRPGKVEYMRPMTALDAIMECGGFDARAGARRDEVHVIRNDGARLLNRALDLDKILTEGGSAPFYVRPFDTIYVPGAW
jgi:polysaccharide export outer membrane protein